MAAAVLRPIGSVRTRLRDAEGNCFLSAAVCSALVTLQMRSGEISGRRRATVCSSIVCLPTIFRSCLGVRVRLRGQKRVPRPPARITAWTGSFSSGIEGKNLTQRHGGRREHGDELETGKPQVERCASVEDGMRKRVGRNARVLPTFFGRSQIGNVGTEDGRFAEWLDNENVQVGGDKPALTRSIRRVSAGPANLAGAAEDSEKFETRFIR